MSIRQHRTPSPTPPRASAAYQGAPTHQINTETPGEIEASPRKDRHWLTPLGCGALLVIGCFALWTLWVIPTYNNLSAQWHYGDAHITRLTTNMGQGSEDF